MRASCVLAALTLTLFCPTAPAAVEPHQFDNATQESQYRGLIKELRCLVCQNQNLADSDADLAKDLRAQVYQMVKSGSSDQQIADYMVARFGEFVLYRPRFEGATLLLWCGPFVLVIVGLLVLVRSIRRHAKLPAPPTPEPDDVGTHVELPEGRSPQ